MFSSQSKVLIPVALRCDGDVLFGGDVNILQEAFASNLGNSPNVEDVVDVVKEMSVSQRWVEEASITSKRDRKPKGEDRFIQRGDMHKMFFRHWHRRISVSINEVEEFRTLGRRGIGLFRTYSGIRNVIGVSGHINIKNKNQIDLLSRALKQPIKQVIKNIRELKTHGYVTKKGNTYSIVGMNGMSENRGGGSDRVMVGPIFFQSQKGTNTLMYLAPIAYIHETYLNNRRVLQPRDFVPKHIRIFAFPNLQTGRMNSLFALLRDAVIMPSVAKGSHRNISRRNIIHDPQILSSFYKESLTGRSASAHRGMVKRLDATGYIKHVAVDAVLRFSTKEERDAVAYQVAQAINSHHSHYEIRGVEYGDTMVNKGTCTYYAPRSYNPYEKTKFVKIDGYYLSFKIGNHIETNIAIKRNNLNGEARAAQNELYSNTFCGANATSFKSTCQHYNIHPTIAKASLKRVVDNLANIPQKG